METFDEDIPELFLCPITSCIMKEPVIASDGNTYEKSAVLLWIQDLKKNKEDIISPFDRTPITENLIENRLVKNIILEWIKKNDSLRKENKILKEEIQKLNNAKKNIKESLREFLLT